MTLQHIVFFISILVVLLIGYYDYQTGTQISMMMLYAIPILITSWYCGKL